MEEILPKSYEPDKVEEKWYKEWLERGYFTARTDTDKPPFSMVIPPPNVTGSLHMGHALNNTIQDILARFKRMDGYNVLWVPGTDHAGIATQNVVEKMIGKEGLNRHQLGRKKFVERVWRWKEESGNTIINQLKRLGCTCDWTRQRFTMDEGLSKAVKQVFLTLFKEGLIQRDNRLINWCPRCETALSDLEVEYEEKDGSLYYIKYPFADDETKYLVVATTRPETMLGDTAVAVNPEDKRYKDFIGKELILPLTGRKIPVIADNMVDIDFGTGAVKVTPAHDFADEQTGKRHKLAFISVIDRKGVICDPAPLKYRGMNRFEARRVIVEDLKELGLIHKIEVHHHNVGHCYRCKDVTEPLLTLQWFVRVKALAERAISVVRDGKIRIIPDQWENSYYQWMENIQDWCISRQIWWGHQIPVYYCPDCDGDKIFITMRENQKDTTRINGLYSDYKKEGLSFDRIIEDVDYYLVLAGASPLAEGEACPRCNNKNLIQDPDVLDTWFSSALWPFTTLGWPEKTKELEIFYPTSVLVTGFDILFFWVARMIMMGLKFMDDVPFRDVYIHALVRDASGQKMSKSKGNVIDPLIIMDKFGTDAFRFTLTALAAQGRDVKLSEDRIEGYRHFVNKIWNASRFVLMNIGGYNPDHSHINNSDLNVFDRWILKRLNETIKEVRESYETYNFNVSASSIYRFLWNDYCDWYIELSKLRMEEDAVKYTLWYCLITSLKLLHPIMPYVTEEIYSKLPSVSDSIMVSSFPKAHEFFINQDTEDVEIFINIVRAIRNIKSEMNIQPALKPKTLLVIRDKEKNFIRDLKKYLEALGRCEVSFEDDIAERPKSSAFAYVSGIDIWVNLEGMINVTNEIGRIMKEINKVEKDVEFLSKRLSNEDYLKNAPEAVVEDDKVRLQGFRDKLKRLKENLSFLKELGL
ncbi:MAG: valine--tRNA ligase [Proteobacteria bacterium]|nr:valine--tRNA ligase [Pseudomonadota bacterium]